MIELDQEDLLENSDPYDPPDLDTDDLDSDGFPGLTRANYVDRVRFERVPDENRAIARGSEATPSADPLYIYYRSMSKIPLLTREEEVYLAKKIESAKLNILRLLSLTTISSFKIQEMADELQPAAPMAVPASLTLGDLKREPENEIPLEERNRIRIKEIRRILARLEKLESKYRLTQGNVRGKSHRGRNIKDLARMKKSRESIFLTLQRMDFSEGQIGTLIVTVEDVLRQMEETQKSITGLSRNLAANHKALRETRSRLRDLESQFLTNAAELRKISGLIYENKREMALAKD